MSMHSSSEEAPLLFRRSSHSPELGLTGSSELRSTLDVAHRYSWAAIVHELGILLRGAIPVILAYTLQNSFQTASVLIVGRLSSSPHDLSVAAFSYMFAAGSGWLVALGGSTALDTLATTAFTGSRNKHDLGVLLQRAFILLSLLYVPVDFLWLWAEPLFLVLGQSPKLSSDSAKFLTLLIPGGLGYIYFEIMKKYLQAQEIMRPGAYILLITSPVSAILNYLLVVKWGTMGAPIATGIGYWLSFLGLVFYSKFVVGSECWGGWSWRCFDNLRVFLKLAIMGFIQVGSEFLAFEIVTLAAGRLGEVSLATQSIISTADLIIATIPLGIGITGSARVGNMLGLRDANGAARSAMAAALLSVTVGSCILVLLMSTRNHIAKIFVSDDQRVIELTSKVLPFVALFQIGDGLAASCGGALRGTGRQHIGATINIFTYYCVALPLGMTLAFHVGMGLPGLWIGLCVALSMVGLLQFAFVVSSDWEQQIANAFERMDKDHSAADENI